MKKRLFLHIGMGKTGTTALQDFFWINRRELSAHGITYPKYAMMAHAHHLVSPYRPPDLKSHWKFRSVAEWAPKMQKVSTDTILLSSELVAWAAEAEVVDFCNSVCEIFDLRVIIYLRRQDNILMANYNQLVKSGVQQNELDWVLEDELARFDYARIIEPWARSIGAEKVIVRPYERQQFYGGDICRDFMHHVFAIDINADFKLPQGDPNPRFSHAALEYKLQLNRLFEDVSKSFRFNKALQGYCAQYDGADNKADMAEVLLSPARRSEILCRCRNTNERIARDYLHRDDGLLFHEAVPDQSGDWAKPKLDDDEGLLITRFLELNDSGAYKRLVTSVSRGNTSLRPRRIEAVDFFRKFIPAESLAKARRSESKSVKAAGTRDSPVRADKLLLISVHFPLVAMNTIEPLLRQQFGSNLVMDYKDRPLALSGPGRNLEALRKSLSFSWVGATLEHDTCVHGHFMPLKFLLPSRGHRKRFVTWMSDPVERLVAHYVFWKGSVKPFSKSSLHARMIEQDWSLETFCLHPEMKNLYSKYLCGFPMSRFDFIGISEFCDTDLQRFSMQILGGPLDETSLQRHPAVDKACIDPALRSRIEHYHRADMALYRSALEIREKNLKLMGKTG